MKIKTNPNGRVCAICGRWGGSGMTMPLQFLGYDIPKGEIGYAHANCVHKERVRQGLAISVPKKQKHEKPRKRHVTPEKLEKTLQAIKPDYPDVDEAELEYELLRLLEDEG
jgi:hypothetical protein